MPPWETPLVPRGGDLRVLGVVVAGVDEAAGAVGGTAADAGAIALALAALALAADAAGVEAAGCAGVRLVHASTATAVIAHAAITRAATRTPSARDAFAVDPTASAADDGGGEAATAWAGSAGLAAFATA